jgi:hypothetical protein
VCKTNDQSLIDQYFGRHAPGIAEHVAGLVDSAARVAGAMARWIAAGSPKVSPEIREERIRICKACVDYYDPINDRCRICTCAIKQGVVFLPEKTAMATEACPVGKWFEVNIMSPEPSQEKNGKKRKIV